MLSLNINGTEHRADGSRVDHHADHFRLIDSHRQFIRRVAVQEGVGDQLADHQHGIVDKIPAQIDRQECAADEVASLTDRLRVIAKTPTMLGRPGEACQTLHALVRLAETSPPSDPWGFWRPSQLHFTESWVYAGAGDEAAADKARDKVLNLTHSYVYEANVVLHGALCTVVRGGTDEGVRQATATISGLSRAYRSTHIIETGRMVLRAVPVDQQDRPTVVEFRGVLAAESGRDA
jgi:hypothetical protein